MRDELTLSDIENTLYHLNYRWKLQALAMWNGQKTPFRAYEIYDGFSKFISRKTLSRIDTLDGHVNKKRLRHALMDHYVQRALLPHETEMRSWMKGAAAHVRGEKIYLRDVIPWCQKRSTYHTRQILQKETGPLAKFLKPFALNYWDVMLRTLEHELGFESYLAYLTDKKDVDYAGCYSALKEMLAETDDLYFSAMEAWARERFGRGLEELTRFDAIYLLSLGHLDHFLPQRSLEELIVFFDVWKINLKKTPGLHLILGREDEKSNQAICFVLEVPEEIYVVMKPEGGWIDVETLWHELGHGLSAVFTSPALSLVDREMATSFSLSESFAFLNQNVTLSVPFLTDFLDMSPSVAEEINYYKVLKDLSLFRRYAAKFLTEYEMFSSGDLGDGRVYGENMRRYTGFYYQPESHLLDLVPEFYSLDYLMGWITESILADHLKKTLGHDWMLRREAGTMLKQWWNQGNQYEIPEFLDRNGFKRLHMEGLMRLWRERLAA
ncbi:MAG: hypothetical protein P8165_09240 [Deltaproteobacteria bacterium]